MATRYTVDFVLTVVEKWTEDEFSLTPENLQEIINCGILECAKDPEKVVSEMSIFATQIQ